MKFDGGQLLMIPVRHSLSHLRRRGPCRQLTLLLGQAVHRFIHFLQPRRWERIQKHQWSGHELFSPPPPPNFHVQPRLVVQQLLLLALQQLNALLQGRRMSFGGHALGLRTVRKEGGR